VGDDQGGAARQDRAQGGLHQAFRRDVEQRGRLVATSNAPATAITSDNGYKIAKCG
jgi:hypothetical protein